eukprot:COSAG04_NODE_891_length_9607_cov_13.087085_6_plen_100_part_00
MSAKHTRVYRTVSDRPRMQAIYHTDIGSSRLQRAAAGSGAVFRVCAPCERPKAGPAARAAKRITLLTKARTTRSTWSGGPRLFSVMYPCAAGSRRSEKV